MLATAALGYLPFLHALLLLTLAEGGTLERIVFKEHVPMNFLTILVRTVKHCDNTGSLQLLYF